MFRVKEINPAYNKVPLGELIWVPDENGILNEEPEWIEGPGWIYCSNEIETEAEALQYALTHTQKTGYKTEVVTFKNFYANR
jgi:hypothetical protein